MEEPARCSPALIPKGANREVRRKQELTSNPASSASISCEGGVATRARLPLLPVNHTALEIPPPVRAGIHLQLPQRDQSSPSVCTFLFTVQHLSSAMTGHQWGYGEDDGPSAWHKDYPIAEGPRQSPINIVPEEAVYDSNLTPITLNYDNCASVNISNNGHSVVVDFDDADDRSVMQGGPLDSTYRLKQFHFHWGGKGCHGSEHTVSGKTYTSELHLVHWNSARYSSFGEAVAAPDGLAVLGIFLERGDEHRGLHAITDALYMVKFKGTVADFRDFNPKCLLPRNLNYWTYPGSLTTPPLYESVTWIILAEPIVVSEKQMGKFRMLLFSGEEEEDRKRMENNFRPPQPLKGRTVRASFK
ncbi:hypothetical protein SRHO_G00304480 [Serrasalmus rhombeus]